MIGIVMLVVAMMSIGIASRAAKLQYPELPDHQWTTRMQRLAAKRVEIEKMAGFDQLKAMEQWLAEFDQLNQNSMPLQMNKISRNDNIVILHR